MSLIKITILGDITCDRPLLEASKKGMNQYSFKEVFSQIKPFLNSSDYVIANYETVCAGNDNGYQNEFFLYNTPDDLVRAMKDAGINFVTTANNHCLDQGIGGMNRTLVVLDQQGIAHTGTFSTESDRDIKKQVIDIGGIKVAILAYTYGTNESNTGIVLDDTNDFMVGLLRTQRDSAVHASGIKGMLAQHLSAKQRRALKRLINRIKLRLGISYFKPFTDQIAEQDIIGNPYLKKIENEIKEAKEQSDLVIVCPHMGGQFNTEPGTYSEFLISYLKCCGVDIIAANHPHVIQRVEIDKDRIAAYSIGSFNLSMSADYIIKESLPEYSMALHVYLNSDSKRIDQLAFSILKNVETETHQITVYPVHLLPHELLDNQTRMEITAIYNRITGEKVEQADICEEYYFAGYKAVRE